MMSLLHKLLKKLIHWTGFVEAYFVADKNANASACKHSLVRVAGDTCCEPDGLYTSILRVKTHHVLQSVEFIPRNISVVKFKLINRRPSFFYHLPTYSLIWIDSKRELYENGIYYPFVFDLDSEFKLFFKPSYSNHVFLRLWTFAKKPKYPFKLSYLNELFDHTVFVINQLLSDLLLKLRQSLLIQQQLSVDRSQRLI